MTIRLTWRHVWPLALGAFCLWVDLRMFLFYAFAVVLGEFERLSAFVRQTTLDHEAKLAALCYNARIPAEDIQSAAVGIMKAREAHPALK